MSKALRLIDADTFRSLLVAETAELQRLIDIHIATTPIKQQKKRDTKLWPYQIMAGTFIRMMDHDPTAFVHASEIAKSLGLKQSQVGWLIKGSRDFLANKNYVLMNQFNVGYKIADPWEALCEAIKSDRRGLSHLSQVIRRCMLAKASQDFSFNDNQFEVRAFIEQRVRDISTAIDEHDALFDSMPLSIQQQIEDMLDRTRSTPTKTTKATIQHAFDELIGEATQC